MAMRLRRGEARQTKKTERGSLQRGATVAKELKRTGIERNITMLGLGHSRYRHPHPGASNAHRERMVHRTDIVVRPAKEES